MKLCACRFCGKMFNHPYEVSVCSNCQDKNEEQFAKIIDYLKRYPNSNAIQIAKGLEISTNEVIRYIDEGRLTIVNGHFNKL
ncbi:MAG: hypothetical protein MJ113_06065 [Lachnospiraceae bacterium]|nr:hypothetical protein [Lachnospiraceae bacterium]